MKAVVTVIGKDNVGIIAEISTECAKHGVNIVDITQSVLRDYFAMIMLVEIENMNATLKDFQLALDTVGKKKGLDIRVMHEDIFNSMHRIQASRRLSFTHRVNISNFPKGNISKVLGVQELISNFREHENISTRVSVPPKNSTYQNH